MQPIDHHDRVATARKRGLGIVGALAGLTLLASTAQAAPLNLNLAPYPDIFASPVTVTYNATTDTLTAASTALDYTDGGSFNQDPIANGVFSLTAQVDSSGVFSSGTFDVTGTLSGKSSPLLQGTALTALGFTTGGNKLEFLFTIGGGSLAADYGGEAAIILTASGLNIDWATNFSRTNGVADIGAQVPTPATLPLLAGGLAALAGLRRRRG